MISVLFFFKQRLVKEKKRETGFGQCGFIVEEWKKSYWL